MKKNSSKIFIYSILLTLNFFAINLQAEVFSLRSLLGGDNKDKKLKNIKDSKPLTGTIRADLDLMLMPAEPMIINGLKLQLGMALTNIDVVKCLEYFKSRYKNVKFKINNNSFMVSFKNDKNEIERYYFFQSKADAMTNCFYTTIPEKAPKKPTKWISGLPQPTGTIPLQTIEIPNRKNSMARFSFVGNKNAVINELNLQLKSQGYIAISKDQQNEQLTKQTGNFFISKDASEIVVFSLSDNGTGSILKKKLPKSRK